MDSTEPGRIGFCHATAEVICTERDVLVSVIRKHGCDGEVSVQYKTQDGDAMAGE
jgi:hypothetical protein